MHCFVYVSYSTYGVLYLQNHKQLPSTPTAVLSKSVLTSFTPTITTYFVLRQLRRSVQSGSSRDCDLMLPLSFSTNFSFPWGRPVADFAFLSRLPVTYVFSSIKCFRRQFLLSILLMQLAFLIFIVCRIFLSSLT